MSVNFFNGSGTRSDLNTIGKKLNDLLLASGWVAENSFSFPFFDNVQTYASGTYTDVTRTAYYIGSSSFQINALATATAGSYYLYVGASTKFTDITVGIGSSGGSLTLVFEYWNGSAWTTLSVTDGTSNWTTAGTTSFTAPTDWAVSSVNGSNSYYFIRISSSTTASTATYLQSITYGTATSEAIPAYSSTPISWKSMIFSMQDTLAKTGSSPWIVKIALFGGTNGSNIMWQVRLSSGTAYDSGTGILTGESTPTYLSQNHSDQSNSPNWMISTNESGFIFISEHNTSADTYLLGMERGRSFTGSTEDTLFLWGSVGTEVSAWYGVLSGITAHSIVSCGRNFTDADHTLKYALMLKASATNGSSDFQNLNNYNISGNTSGVTIGPFGYYGGSFGTPRLFLLMSPVNISNGSTQVVTQDGQNRTFRVFDVSSTATLSAFPSYARVLFATE